MTDDTLTWDNYIDQLISSSNSARYTVRTVKAMLSKKALTILYFSYVHSTIFYGIIFWGDTPKSTKILKKKRIMTNSKKIDSCRELFKIMKLLPFYSQYMFSFLLHAVNNKHLCTKNSEVHNQNTTSANNFHLPITNLTKYQKGAHFAGIKIFNHLPTHIKCLANEIQVFKLALERFLLSNLFYSIDKYFDSNK